MNEQETPRSFEERVAACPIHQSIDVKSYMTRFQIPSHLHRVFQELVLARGEYPKYMSDMQAKQFRKRAVILVEEYKVSPQDGQPLRIMFQQLIQFWLGQGAQFN